ncbi:MAG: peptidoglycan bridge formation glycyltransferase FemA/FemB family protein [Anaerolineaceae bacterium]|jgi:lipid II:glycine glycyltransferase (peptidoglycan interpeptide bridge formation enzyme)|nr:peptidoglycan bridge formation glycyltransferase FemA/FemB family protein [Anaerolineaceae bacterium]
MELIDKNTWEQYFSKLENPHILQTFEWGELKSNFGWTPFRFEHKGSVFQLLMRNLPLGIKIGYLPKSKIEFEDESLWNRIDEFCKSHKVVFLKHEPDFFASDFDINQPNKRFVKAKPIQPASTIEIDLQGNEGDWLSRMKQKTRYNIKLAIKKGIIVEIADNISTFYDLMLDTGKRDNFGVHSKKYYQLAYDLFKPSNVALLLAKYEDIPLAGLMVFCSGNRSWYFYGASNNMERNRMPTYLLQFEAMKWAKSHGCDIYDLWGIPDEPEETLEKDFDTRSDGLWGVYRFKRGFGGVIKKAVPAYDRIYNPVLYRMINFVQKIRGGIN